MAEKLGEALLELRTDDRGLGKGIDQAERKSEKLGATFDRVGKKSMRLGKNLSLGLTAPLGLMAAAAVKGARKQAKAVAQVDAVLESMGNQAGFTSDQLQDMASQLQGNSLFGDEDILNGVTANLLTFGNISEDVFARSQQLALDLSARLDQDLQSSAVMLGKALNDPATGLTALTRVGITFSEQQKAQVKAMVAAGDTAGAQALMLAELEKQYGGQAAAAAKADGGVTQLANSWGDMQEEFGAVILELMPAFISGANDVVSWLKSLDQDTKKWVLGIGLALVAAGPLLIGFGLMASGIGAIIGPLGLLAKGLGLLGPVIGIVGKALLGLLANPIVLAAAALIAGIYFAWKNWDKIKPIIDRVAAAVTQWWNANVKPVLDKIMPLLRSIANFFRDYFGAQIEGAVKIISALLKGDFAGAWAAAKASVSNMVTAALGFLKSLAPGAVASMRALYTGVKTWLQDKLGAVFEWVKAKVAAVEESFGWLFDRVVGNSWVPDLIDAIGKQFDRLGPEMVDDAETATAQVSQSFADMAQNAVNSIDGIVNKIKKGDFLGALQDAIGLLGKFGQFFSATGGGGGIGGFLSGLASSLGPIFGSGGGSAFAGGFATGGLIPTGQFGIVGERGPEPIISTSRGAMVLPNSALREGAPSNAPPININFNGPVSNPEQVRRSAAQAGAALSRAVASGNRGI